MAGALLHDRDIWMLDCWNRGGWARLTEGASWLFGKWHRMRWAEPDLDTLMMLMRE